MFDVQYKYVNVLKEWHKNNNKSHRTLFFSTVYCFESLVENCNKNVIEGTPITEVKPNYVCLQVLLKAFFCSFTKFFN